MKATPMKLYHYTESGLDNVWLRSGYDVKTFGDHGEAVSVHDEDQLHLVLARSIARQDRRLTGQEFRFLRTVLDLTQNAVARRMGYADYQMVARWEKAHHAAPPLVADTLMRAWYLESIGDRPLTSRIGERLAELGQDAGAPERRIFTQSDGWEAEGAPREMAMA